MSVQFITDIILFFAINLVGFFVYYPMELVQRKTFRETRWDATDRCDIVNRRCVETRLSLDRELRKQEKILLSVLPRHIAYEVSVCV